MNKLKVKKRVFLGLLIISLLLLTTLVAGIFYFYYNRTTQLFQTMMIITAALVIILVIISGLGLGAIVLTILGTKTNPIMNKIMTIALRILYPLAIKVGRMMKIPKNIIRSSFVEVNNNLVSSKKMGLSNSELLILAPHCLQKDDCPYKITNHVENCRGCGRCQIRDLIELSKKYNVNLAVVSGGTIARRHVKKFKPKGIIAIACERDLTSGIHDTNPIPVMGILNERPEGPCFNTRVDIKKTEKAIRFFLGEEEKP